MSENGKDIESSSLEEEIRARRLARRKKILENAKNRLDKLNGRSTTLPSGENTQRKVIYPDPEVEQELFNNITTQNLSNDGSPRLSMDSQGIFSILEQLMQNSDSDRTSGMTDRIQPNIAITSTNDPQRPLSDSILDRLVKTKCHIALISAMTFFLFVTDNEKYISYSIFLPLLLWEIGEAFFIKTRQFATAGFLIQIMLLAALPPHYLMPITKAMRTLNKIFEDAGVFVFFFVLYHLFYYSFTSSVLQIDVNV